MDNLNLTIHGDVERLVVNPTDVIIVKIRNFGRLGEDGLQSAKRTVERALQNAGLDNPVLILDGDNVSIEVAGQ